MTDDTPAETGWFWRRSYTFLWTAVNSVFLAVIVWKLNDPAALKWIALALIGANMLLAGLYMAGANILDYAQLAAAWKGGKSEEIKVETLGTTVTQTTTETKSAEAPPADPATSKPAETP